jgi:mono/diheme cytochrome c family protein
MRLRPAILALCAALAAVAGARAQETPEALPDGPGRDETFQACIACHGTAVIRRSRLTREGWDGLMDWMTEKQGMPPLEGEQRRVVVDYLARSFPPATPQQRRGGNPFATQ